MENKTKKEEKEIDYTKFYVKPHKKKSRKVVEGDIERVLKDSEIMLKLCYTKIGIFPGAFAIAHQQINKEDPLRFFVYFDGSIIINPEIINHTNAFVDSEEGCMSFPENPVKKVDRYNKVTVKMQTLTENNKLSDYETKNLNSKVSKVFQHEIDHFDCKYIY